MREQPPGWAADDLSNFLDQVINNIFATFYNKKWYFYKSSNIDSVFLKLLTEWRDPENFVSVLLALRCHSSFRAALQLAMAGQVAESFSLDRSCLEAAAYAATIAGDDGNAEVWLRRHDDRKSQERVRNKFKYSRLRDHIRSLNGEVWERFDVLYQNSIDHGAHPNERAITGNMEILDGEGYREIKSIYLQGDGNALEFALKNVCRSGVCALEVLELAFGERFREVGVDRSWPILRGGL